MLDTAAASSAALYDTMDAINASIYSLPCNLKVFGNCTRGLQDFADFQVMPLDRSFTLHIKQALVGDTITTENETPPLNKDIQHLDFMSDVEFTELEDKTIGLIIDAKFAYTWMMSKEVRFRSPEDPLAIKTDFGWSLIGPPLDPQADIVQEANVCPTTTDEQTLQDQIQTLQDQIHTMQRHDFIMSGHEVASHEQTHPSKMDEYSLKQMKDSIHYDKDLAHYKVALPWRNGRMAATEKFKKLDSYANAKSRLLKEKRKLELDPKRKEGTFKQIHETLGEGHARLVDPNRSTDGLPVWYLPLHVVTRPDKPGKYRICQDAASRVKGTYLNQELCTGPDLLNSLPGILLRFRKHPIAMTADIRAFYHMIFVADEDVAALRFLFFADKSMREIKEYEHLVHIFGASCSPPVANFTLRYHADRIRQKYGEDIFWQIILSFYVDDFISSFPDVHTARDVRIRLTAALAEGGFELTKWDSSHPETLIDDPNAPTPSPTPTCTETPTPQDAAEISDMAEEDNSIKTITEEIQETFKQDDFIADTKDFVHSNPSQPPAAGKVLGAGYDHSTDSLFVRVTDKANMEVKTQRDMLKLVHSVFDPLGMCSPYVLKGRMYYQLANSANLGWDKKLPDEILEPFKKWQSTMGHLKDIKLPRWTSTEEYTDAKSELVLFCDASKEGYGCVAYLRKVIPGKDEAHVSYLFSKSHVVPLNMSKSPVPDQEDHLDSIPRLELCAAKLASIVRDLLVRESGEKFERVFMFSDSITVLNWICDFDRKFKTFENFRVRKIRSLTDTAEWRHCPSNDNPADICSHGLLADEKDRFSFFHQGPPWLRLPVDLWPPIRPKPKSSQKPEEPKPKVTDEADFPPIQLLAINPTFEPPQPVQEDPTPDWRLQRASKESIWPRKVRKIARTKIIFSCFLEFLKLKKQGKSVKDLKLNLKVSLPDYQIAETNLINAIQRHHFHKEIEILLRAGVTNPKARSELRSKSSITSINPFLDENLTLRAGGRLDKSETISYDAKFPKILPRNDIHVTHLIRYIHQKHLHPQINHTFHYVRNEFFVLGGRTTVNHAIKNCITCQIHDKPPIAQKQGDLPHARVNYVKPFQNTGIDVMGPFTVKHGGRGSCKRWVLLSTCMATRAISLLPLKDMSTPTFINALIKLHNQFPGIEVIFSDQGSNFKGASREIKDAVANWNSEQINENMMAKGIVWNFGPPNAPHTGGVWERLVRSAKRHLKFILETEPLDYDTFETALTQVSAILNNRPLTHATNDINDMRTLSPANFLYPYMITPSSTTILPPIPADGDHLRGSWRDVRRLSTLFADRWRHEYLTTLLPQTKWKKTAPNLYVGQLVLMVDDAFSRHNWKLAKVEELLSDDKNHIRRVIVSTADKKRFERHVQALIPLELDQETDEPEPVQIRRSERLKNQQ